MWKEEEASENPQLPGQKEQPGRVNHARVRQLMAGLPEGGAGAASAKGGCALASACPFCKTMLTDSLADQGHETVAQMDIAEILWTAVNPESAPQT